MKFNTYLGKKVEGAYEDYIARVKEAKAPETAANPLTIKANINPVDYIRIPNTDVVIAREETNKGLKWNQTHYALADNGLFMPTPSLFMPYFLNVKDAGEGKIILYTADNKEIPIDEAEDLWKYLSSNHRGGCWTWLDAKFSNENNSWKIAYDHKVIKKNGNKSLEGKAETLENCIREDGFVDLEFNNQGLPVKKSLSKEYKQGGNIYFYHPRDGSVARFRADSGRAVLNCYRYPDDSDSSLGVFSCAAGARR